MVLRIGNIRVAILTICQLIGLFFALPLWLFFLLLFVASFSHLTMTSPSDISSLPKWITPVANASGVLTTARVFGKKDCLNRAVSFMLHWLGNEEKTAPADPSTEEGMVLVRERGELRFHCLSVLNRPIPDDLKAMAKAEKAQIVDHLLDVVGLRDFKEKAVYELSGGMQQRVALARCLANEPEVILMDEPLGALDALTREKMQGLVLKLWKETGKTVILITHSVEEALLLGERLLVMAPRPGRIHKEYQLPFAEMGVNADLRTVKKHPEFGEKREEILSMIWEMEEEIMGRTETTDA